MASVSEAQILETLKAIKAPGSDSDIVSLGLISGLVVKDGNVGFAIEIAPEQADAFAPVRDSAEESVHALAGVNSVTAVLTAHRGRRHGPSRSRRRTTAPGRMFIRMPTSTYI